MVSEDQNETKPDTGDDEEAVAVEPETLSDLESQLKQAKSDYLYLAAEFDNYKKQAIKERSELLRYGGERLARELLNVLDNFERALSVPATADTIEPFRKGIDLTATEFRSSLGKFGIQEVDSLGAPFDPMMHEAIGSEESHEVEPGHITRVLKKAFKMHDRLIRPAQVIVAKEPAKDAGQQ